MALNRLEYISDIIATSLVGDLDEKGKHALNEWLNESHLNRNFYETLQKSFASGEALRELSCYNSIGDWVLVKRKIARNRRRTVYQRSLYSAATIAGISVLLFVLILPFADKRPYDAELLSQNTGDTTLVKKNYKALLILSTGNTLDLGKELELDDGKIKNDGTTLEYNTHSAGQTEAEPPRMHILKVPRGAEYKVVLADGSTVHLNADSELRYPEYFSRDNRIVELFGEAYFNVAHYDDKPFIIVNGDMKITAIGTSFNLKAYDAGDRRTTLAEGRVRIEKEDCFVEINPGQQAFEHSGGLMVSEVIIEEHIGWKNKRLIYRSTPLETIARDIERYYDKRVVFSGESGKLRLTANIPRYENVAHVLDIISNAMYVDISIDENVISIHGQSRRN